MGKNWKILFGMLTVLLLFQGCVSDNAKSITGGLSEKLMSCSVEILADGKMSASGSFVSADGYVLTAGHFVKSPEMEMEVLYGEGQRAKAVFVGIDRGHDIALLKVEVENEVAFLEVCKDDPRQGESIYVVGSPLNKHSLMLSGMVASQQAEYEHLNDQRTYIYVWYIQAMSPRGLSGGCWVNSEGQIVGVQSGFANDEVTGGGSANSGVAFVGDYRAIARLIETKQSAANVSLSGVLEELWTQAPGFQKRFGDGAEGVVIHEVHKGGALEKAGLVHEDLIVAADGKKVRYRKELLGIVRSKKPGDKIELKFVKPDGKEGGKKQVVLDCLEDKGKRK